MAWIKTIPYVQSTGKLRMLYDRVKGNMIGLSPENSCDGNHR